MTYILRKMKHVLVAILLVAVMTSCYNDKSVRHLEYAPNMYNSLPLEPYSQTEYWETNIGGNYPAVPKSDYDNQEEIPGFVNGTSAQKPVAGTVPRGTSWYYQEDFTPYQYPDSEQYRIIAGTTVFSPLNDSAMNATDYNCSTENHDKGKELYEIFCVMCHGAQGKGQGILVQKEVFLGVPSYWDAGYYDMPVGRMFHSITYGKGVMGGYGSQLTPKERWQVICYIQEFQEQGAAQAASATASAAPSGQTSDDQAG